MSSKLESVAAMKAVELEQAMENTQFDVSWMFSRDAVTNTLLSSVYNNVTQKQWEDLSSYFNAMITSKQGYQAIVIYDWNMTQIYSLEHSDSASSLTALLATMTELLPLQQPSTVNTTVLQQTGILQNPTAVVTKGKMVSYSYSMTLPIVVEISPQVNNATNSTTQALRRELLVGYGTVVMSAQPLLDTEQLSSNTLHDNSIYLGEAAHNTTDDTYGYGFLFPPSGWASLIYPMETFPSMREANALPESTTVERYRGSMLRTFTPFDRKASTGYSYSRVMQRRWLVVVSIPQNVAYADVVHLRNRVIGTAAGVLGGLLLVIVPIGRAFTASLYRIYNSLVLRPFDEPGRKSPYVISPKSPKVEMASDKEGDVDGTDDDDDSGNAHQDSCESSTNPSNSSGDGGHNNVVTGADGEDTETTKRSSSLSAANSEHERSSATAVSIARGHRSEALHLPQKLPRLNRFYVDELDELVEEYNNMINKLDNQYRNLDDQVRVRTHEAQEARILAESANAAKSKFIANITHELRTPLNGIMGMTSISLSEQNVDKIRNNLKVILDSGRVLMELLNELLTFSKNQIDLVPEVGNFTPAELLENVDNIFRARADAKSLSVSLIAVPDELNNLQLCGDSYRMFQVIVNFMSNAIKFSDENGSVSVLASLYPEVDSRISMAPYAKAQNSLSGPLAMLEVSVTDRGPGMSERQLARIFEPFTQGDESLSKRHEGTGLGMSMCKQLAEGIGGYVVVWSSEGRSSTALLRAPVQIVTPAPNLANMFYRPPPVLYPDTYYTLSLSTGNVKKLRPPAPQRRHLTVDTRHQKKTSSAGSGTSLETPFTPFTRQSFLNNSSTSLLFGTLPPPHQPPRTSNSPVSTATFQTAKGTLHDSASPPAEPVLIVREDEPSSSGSYQSAATPGTSGGLSVMSTTPSRHPRSPNDDLTEAESEFAAQAHPDIKVLVADDNQLNVRILKSMLERMGVKVVDTASSGRDAIGLVEKSIKDGVHYTIIFMDLVMPDINGLEATQVIRGTLGYPYPIVALTGFSDQQTRDACETANIQEVLVKPILRNALLRIIIRYHQVYS